MNAIHSYRALIVGAGVAGLTAAAGLRSRGWEVTVVERAPELREGGYKLDIRGAGVEVMRRLGLLERARAASCAIGAGSVVTEDGQTVAAMGGDTFGGRRGEDVELERGDLIRILADAAGEIRFSTTVTGLDQIGNEVRATFDDGTNAAFDVVLGADGLRSQVRSHVVGDRDTSVRDLGHAIAVVTMPDSLGLTDEETTFVTGGATALLYATATRPRARAMLLFTHSGDLPRERGDQVAFLRERFAGIGWRVPEVLAALETADDIYLDSISQVTLAPWSRDRVGLIGDAAACASPASGQGTTLALVTAWVTCAELTRTPADVPGALARAERSLRPFVERNQKLGPSNLKRMVLPTDKAVRQTVTALRVMNALPFTDLLLGAVARQLHRASAFDLPAMGVAGTLGP